MNEMTYNEWLEKELNIYKRENKLLYEKQEMFDDIYRTIESNSKKIQEKNKQILKWAYSLEKEKAQLKEELFNKNKIISKRLVESEILNENKQLKSDINYHFNLKMEYLLENQKLKQELFDIYKEK